jgi:hypothetical protein
MGSSASKDELGEIAAPSIDGPAGGGLAWPNTPLVRFRVVAKHWADIRKMLTAGEYVDGESLVTALIAHRWEPVEPRVLPYLCAFLLGRARRPGGRKPKPASEPGRVASGRRRRDRDETPDDSSQSSGD